MMVPSLVIWRNPGQTLFRRVFPPGRQRHGGQGSLAFWSDDCGLDNARLETFERTPTPLFASPYSVDAEVNNGRGPVDFRVSLGAADQTLVEFKLATRIEPYLELGTGC